MSTSNTLVEPPIGQISGPAPAIRSTVAVRKERGPAYGESAVGVTIIALGVVALSTTACAIFVGAASPSAVMLVACGVALVVLGDYLLARAAVERSTRVAVLGPNGLRLGLLKGAGGAGTTTSGGIEVKTPVLRLPVIRFPAAGVGWTDLTVRVEPARRPYTGVVQFFVVPRGPETKGTVFRGRDFPRGLRFELTSDESAAFGGIGLACGARVSLSTVGAPRCRIDQVRNLGDYWRLREELVLHPGLTSVQILTSEDVLWAERGGGRSRPPSRGKGISWPALTGPPR